MVNMILNPSGGLSRRIKRQPAPTLLTGVKRRGILFKSGGVREPGGDLARRGEVAYWVGSPPQGSRAFHGEMRSEARQRTRLRSAKLLDATYNFICEGRVHDRSVNGLRILVARDVSLPTCVAIHIDEAQEVRCARIIWRSKAMLGVRLLERAPRGTLAPSDRFALRERYYGVSNRSLASG